MVRAHRQAWCWQDEWYGLTMEDIRQLELETQLALATKMAQFSQAEEATETNGGAPSPDKVQEAKEAISSIEAEEVVVSTGGETLQPRGVLTKQWSTSSRSSRSSKRGGEENAVFTAPCLPRLCLTVCETYTGVGKKKQQNPHRNPHLFPRHSPSVTKAMQRPDPYFFLHTLSHLYLHLIKPQTHFLFSLPSESTLKGKVYFFNRVKLVEGCHF